MAPETPVEKLSRIFSSGEPVFVLRSKDLLALKAVRAYREACLDVGLRQQAQEVQKALDEMENWRLANRDKLSVPDHRHVPRNGHGHAT